MLALSAELDARVLDSTFLRFARSHPLLYLKILGHLLVMTELIALLTPLVAMGLQWVTALCDGAPIESLIELLQLCFSCVKDGTCSGATFQQSALKHCIVRT